MYKGRQSCMYLKASITIHFNQKLLFQDIILNKHPKTEILNHTLLYEWRSYNYGSAKSHLCPNLECFHFYVRTINIVVCCHFLPSPLFSQIEQLIFLDRDLVVPWGVLLPSSTCWLVPVCCETRAGYQCLVSIVVLQDMLGSLTVDVEDLWPLHCSTSIGHDQEGECWIAVLVSLLVVCC